MNQKSLRTDDCVERIVDEYSGTVYKLAFAQTRNTNDAEDVFQEVFLRYIRKRPFFDSKEHEKAWFIRVTINCCKNIWISPFRKHEQLSDDYEAIAGMGENSQIGQFLSKLPSNYRTVIHLFYYEDMSTAQISKSLNKKESTVRVQLTRARRLLKEYMEGAGYNV